MRDMDDESRIKAYMQAKMKHIKMYNESMNLADGLDVAKFAELVRQDEREEVLILINEIMGMESDRNKLFSEGYDYALGCVEEFIEGRKKRARGDA